MSYIIVIIFVISFIISSVNGTVSQISTAIITECSSAVTLSMSLCGSICFWNGIMNVCDKAGIVKFISGLLKPLLCLLFRNLKADGEALGYIVMNFIANLLGLGNASTPLGIKAMEAIAKEENADDYATDNMIMLVILNTAALQLFPATVTAIRAKYNSVSPTDILPCVLIVSLTSLTITLISAKLLGKITGRKG